MQRTIAERIDFLWVPLIAPEFCVPPLDQAWIEERGNVGAYSKISFDGKSLLQSKNWLSAWGLLQNYLQRTKLHKMCLNRKLNGRKKFAGKSNFSNRNQFRVVCWAQGQTERSFAALGTDRGQGSVESSEGTSRQILWNRHISQVDHVTWRRDIVLRVSSSRRCEVST